MEGKTTIFKFKNIFERFEGEKNNNIFKAKKVWESFKQQYLKHNFDRAGISKYRNKKEKKGLILKKEISEAKAGKKTLKNNKATKKTPPV